MEHNLRELEETIGYHFTRRGLLKNAMTHSSYANEQQWEKTRCNERLEFLGDAVLELSTSEFLFRTYKEMPEGELTKTRASLVCEPTLAFCAEEIRLGEYLLLGNGEEATGGRFRPSVVSDAMEALIGAISLDGEAGCHPVSAGVGGERHLQSSRPAGLRQSKSGVALRVTPLLFYKWGKREYNNFPC